MKYLLDTASYLFVFGITLSTLTWIRIYSFNNINIGYSHLFLLVFNILLIVFALNRPPKISRKIKNFLFVSVILILFLSVLFLFSQLTLRNFLRPTAYFINAINFSILVFYSSERLRKLFVLLPFMISLIFVGAIVYASTYTGLNTFQLIFESLSKGDSSILLFGVLGRLLSSSAFNTELEFIQINLRHEVSSLLLFSLYLSLTFFSQYRSYVFKSLANIGLIFTLTLLVILLSRAVLLALVMTTLHLMSVSREFRRKYLSTFVIFLSSLIPLFSRILYSRFFLDTQSYSERGERLDGTLNLLYENPFFPSDQSQSIAVGDSHMWFFELWKLGGLSGFIISFLFLLYLIYFLFMSYSIYSKLTSGYSNYIFAFLALWLPVIRIFTAGSALGLNEWLCIGLFIGVFNLIDDTFGKQYNIFRVGKQDQLS